MNETNKGTVAGLDLDSVFSSDVLFRIDLKNVTAHDCWVSLLISSMIGFSCTH